MITRRFLNSWFLLAIFLICWTPLHAQSPSATTATILLTDISGSMDEQDVSGLVKIDASIQASLRFLDSIEAERVTTGGARQDLLSLVTFCDSAQEAQGFTEDLSLMRTAITNLNTCGRTNMLEGVELTANAFNRISGQLPIDQKIVILLSDGLPTASRSGSQDANQLKSEVLTALSAFRINNICLYVIPLGDPTVSSGNDRYVDLNFLQQMVDTVGCGELYDAQNSSLLNQVYLDIRASSIGRNVLFRQTDFIAQNQVLELPDIIVPAGQTEFRVDTAWGNGTLQTVLFDPNNRMVDANYPNAQVVNYPTLSQILVRNPAQGVWRTSVIGSSVGTQGTTFSVIASSSPSSTLPPIQQTNQQDNMGTYLGIMLIIAVIAGGGITAFFMQRQPRQNHLSLYELKAHLLVQNGPMQGQIIPIATPIFNIGRKRGNELILADRSVSRFHARITYNNGNFYVEDVGGQSGVMVNGQRVMSHLLRSNDQIQVGKSQFAFRIAP